MLSLMATLAELVSMAPTSGGQYHWVSMLAPARYQKFLGYITGWLTLTPCSRAIQALSSAIVASACSATRARNAS